jgi:hypothetical protein
MSARAVGWATAKLIVQALVLSQQDDQCAQSRLVNQPLARLDQSLGQWWACDEPFGRSNSRVRSTPVFKGELDLPGMTNLASGSLSLAWPAGLLRVRDFTRWVGWQFQG